MTPTNYTGAPETRNDPRHTYLSTACLHAQQEGREELHEYCRCKTTLDGEPKIPGTCKWCGAPCICGCHQEPSR